MHRRIALFLLTFVLLSPLAAQISLSPYSRYGLGDLYNPTSTRNFSMGSVGIGAFDGTTVNRINPASYADIRLTTLDINGFGSFSLQESDINSQNVGTAGFHNVSFAFSNKRNFGFVAGLAPYSSTGYDVTVSQTLQIDTASEPYTVNYNSDGGLNQFYLGAGFRFFRHFYAGANLTLAFGSTTYTTTSVFTSTGFNTISIFNRSQLSGLLPQFGLQYGDTLRLKTNVDRAKATEQDIAEIDKALANLDKEDQQLDKDNEKLLAWQEKEQVKADALQKEKESLQSRVAELMKKEDENKKEIGKLQDKLFRVEKQRKKVVREIKNRTREISDLRGNIKGRRRKLSVRKEALELELAEIRAGKRAATVERRKNFVIRVGGIFEPATSLNGNRLLEFNNSFIADTLFNDEGQVNLPTKYGFGFTFGRSNRWVFGADVSYQDWSNFSYFNDANSLNGQLNLNVGGEIIPDLISRKYRNRIAYRLGGYYNSTFLTLEGNPIPEYGVTFGVGLPIGFFNAVGANFSRVNLGLSVGRRGTRAGNLLEETTIQLRVGVNLNDVWFIKRVVD
ncbi:MAG: hypothetical protein AAGN35_01965 [Bacteroidota bacterium]